MVNAAILILWILLVIALSVVGRKSISSRRLSIVRALFPSWRFFDRLEHVPKVFICLTKDEREANWQELSFHWPRSLVNVAFNPQGNLNFAFCSLLDQLQDDANEFAGHENFEEMTSYKLFVNLLNSILVERALAQEGQKYKFKVRILSVLERQFVGESIVSLEHKVGAHG